MPTSVAGIAKLCPISLSKATGMNSVVLKINAAKAKLMTLTHCWVTLGLLSVMGEVILGDISKIAQSVGLIVFEVKRIHLLSEFKALIYKCKLNKN